MRTTLERNLQIFLVTRNRAAALTETLTQLADSPFRACRLVIMDNASDDGTAEVCDTFRSRFEQLTIVRREMDLGAEGNYIAALQAASRCDAPYSWVLCDDDLFVWDGARELSDHLANQTSEVILVGSPGLEKRHLGFNGRVGDLMRQGCRFHFVATFVPGVIFRSGLITETVLQTARNLGHLYWPSFPLVRKVIEDNARVTVVSIPLVHRLGTADLPSVLYCWVTCALTTASGPGLHRAIRDLFPNHSGVRYAAMALRERLRGGLPASRLWTLWKRLPLRAVQLRLIVAWLLIYPIPLQRWADRGFQRLVRLAG